MAVHVKDGGTWHRIIEGSAVKDVGVFQELIDATGGIFVKDAGVWNDARAAEEQTAGVITQGADFLYTYTYTFSPYSTYPVTARGFNSATDHDYEWPRTIAFGSMTLGADFWDSRGVLRKIAALYKVPYFFNTILFSLDGINIPDDDLTFKSITIDDTASSKVHERSDAFYFANTNGGTTWAWDDDFSGTPPTRRWGTGNLTVTVQFK